MTTTLLKATRANGSLPFPKPALAVSAAEAPALPKARPTPDLYQGAELKPCPFCGAKALPPEPTSSRGRGPNSEHSISCMGENCLCVMFGKNLIETITRWNRRAALTSDEFEQRVKAHLAAQTEKEGE